MTRYYCLLHSVLWSWWFKFG